MNRRQVFGAGLLAALASPAYADDGFNPAPDVVVACDPALLGCLARMGRRFRTQTGAPVRLFTAPDFVIRAQVAHQAHADLLVMRTPALQQAGQEGLLQGGARRLGWRNALVLARRGGAPPAQALPDLLAALPAGARIAATDATSAASIDGPAVLLGLGVAPERIAGAAENADVIHLIKGGGAALGLLYRSEALAEPALGIAAVVGPAADYAAALSRNNASRYAGRFLDFLQSGEAAAQARAGGLETSA